MDGCNISLRDILTQAKIRQAFDIAVKEHSIPEGKLVLITEDRYDDVKVFMENTLVKDDPVCKSLSLCWSDDMDALCMFVLEQNLSFMLIDAENGDIIGLRIMTIGNIDDKLPAKNFTDVGMQKLAGFWEYNDQKSQFYQHYDITEAIHFFGLSVAEKYRRRGIATKLIEVAMSYISNFGVFPIHVRAYGSSNYSQRIFEKHGFDALCKVPFEEYKENGEVVVRSIDGHTTNIAYGKAITSKQ